jgi:hypothetical protein
MQQTKQAHTRQDNTREDETREDKRQGLPKENKKTKFEFLGTLDSSKFFVLHTLTINFIFIQLNYVMVQYIWSEHLL